MQFTLLATSRSLKEGVAIFDLTSISMAGLYFRIFIKTKVLGTYIPAKAVMFI